MNEQNQNSRIFTKLIGQLTSQKKNNIDKQNSWFIWMDGNDRWVEFCIKIQMHKHMFILFMRRDNHEIG